MSEAEEVHDDGQGEELFEHHRLVADPGQTPLRVDKFIINRVAHLSRNKLQTAAKSGYVRVNGEPVKSNHKVKPEDVVTVELPQPVYEFELLPEPMDLDVVHEDDHVLVINKPMNLVVHPGTRQLFRHAGEWRVAPLPEPAKFARQSGAEAGVGPPVGQGHHGIDGPRQDRARLDRLERAVL